MCVVSRESASTSGSAIIAEQQCRRSHEATQTPAADEEVV